MTAQIIDGKAIAAKVQRELGDAVAEFWNDHGRVPSLRAIIVGDDKSSQTLVRNKQRMVDGAGMTSEVQHVAADVSEADLRARVSVANADPEVDAILVQLPLPAMLDTDRVLASIDVRKDVDGLTPHNAGLLAAGKPLLIPGTARGCLRLLDEIDYKLAGKRVLVIGRSALVGRPTAQLLLTRDATVTTAHSQTTDLPQWVADSDVVVAAAGKAGLVRGAWIKPGAVVIDVGLNRDADGKLCGDVEFTAASERAAFITPVPGGVGPMTAVMLAANTLAAARLRSG